MKYNNTIYNELYKIEYAKLLFYNTQINVYNNNYDHFFFHTYIYSYDY